MDSDNRQQLELLSRHEPHTEPVTPELIRSIRRRPTFLSAWNFSQDFAGLQDKQCYGPLKIDSSHWTKIRKGNASPPADECFDNYLNITGNEIPLIWWVERRGYDWMSLRKHRDDKDRRINELEQKVADYERLFRLQTELRGR